MQGDQNAEDLSEPQLPLSLSFLLKAGFPWQEGFEVMIYSATIAFEHFQIVGETEEIIIFSRDQDLFSNCSWRKRNSPLSTKWRKTS